MFVDRIDNNKVNINLTFCNNYLYATCDPGGAAVEAYNINHNHNDDNNDDTNNNNDNVNTNNHRQLTQLETLGVQPWRRTTWYGKAELCCLLCSGAPMQHCVQILVKLW